MIWKRFSDPRRTAAWKPALDRFRGIAKRLLFDQLGQVEVESQGHRSRHKNRVFLSEVFRFEKLGFELSYMGVIESSFETWRLESSMPKTSVIRLHRKWSEFAAERVGLIAEVDNRAADDR